MKKFIVAAVVAIGVSMAVPAVAPAWVSVATAEERSASYWNSFCCSPNYTWRNLRTYQRISNDRVDILGNGWRNGVYGCRWTIVSSSTGGSTTWTRWHPDREFVPGCGGV